MIMDRTCLSFRPTQNKQIEFSISCVHQCSCVPAEQIALVINTLWQNKVKAKINVTYYKIKNVKYKYIKLKTNKQIFSLIRHVF
jgi:hypothetical protein